MSIFKNQIKSQEPEDDRVAKIIAGQIIRWQAQASHRLNRWINGYSRKKQRIILMLSGILTAGALITSLTPYAGQVPLHTKGNYIPQHIGEPSERIRLKDPTNKTTDSITNKK
ncbi:MAG: hypothetical protein JWR38_2828 [Mucilaginibacter sp.]|nr:hypothetical protein [Mucilaginibacter sp.]